MKLLIVMATLVATTGLASAQATQQTPPPQPPAAAAKVNADVTGTWDVMVTTTQGDIPATLVLKKDGEKIVGTISSPQGEAPVEASVEEKSVSVWFNMDSASGPIGIAMNGTIDGNTIKGMVDIGGATSASWVATRAAATPAAKTADTKPAPDAKAAQDVSGTWILEVNTPAGTGTPTLVLKQDGEKLTGTYASNQFGEAPITGTLKGNAIEFAFDLNIEGNAVTVFYKGTVDKGTMGGSLKFGEYADGTFTGKKK